MSLHIGAKTGEIAETVLITGDPLRAKHFAETGLTNSVCMNKIRAMYGYTGLYKETRVSVMGTGIGIPSTALYLYELIHAYGVKNIIRLGTTGAIQRDLELGQIIVANKSQTDSNAVELLSQTSELMASPSLLAQAHRAASVLNLSVKTGDVFSTDLFYRDDDATRWTIPSQQGVLGVDMETAMLYAMGMKYNVQCLAILTVSDNILTGEITTAQHRETKTSAMLTLALEIAAAIQ
jgi:purine-nucleoside phosphorylase